MKSCRFLLGLVSLAFCCAAFGQSTNASLTGVVDDPSKAVISRVSVTAINTETGAKTRTFSDKSGQYVLPQLPPGPYRLEVDKQGFKGIIEAGLTLHVQDAVQMNFHMAVGSMSETVTVNADAQQAETGGAISTVIDHTFIENMPLNGNSLSTLFELTPGVVTNTGSSAQGGGLSVNGQRATSNYLSVDGTSANIYVPLLTGSGSTNVTGQGIAVSASGGTNGLLPIDAVEEYRIQTSTYSAEYGRTPGGQIGVKTRGGTNEFHGSVFENFRNQVMDATDYFIKYLDEKQTPLRMNDFGGTLGGPILKNKLFFFVAHESLLMDQPAPGYSADVPSSCAKTTAASVFQPFLAAYPVGNAGPDVTQPLCNSSEPESSTNQPISDILNESFSTIITDHSTSARLDANLPWRSRAFFRFNDAPSNQLTANWYPYNEATSIRTSAGGVTTQISPRIINEATINYSQNKTSYGQSLASYGGNNPSAFVNAVASIANPATTEFEFASTVWSGTYPTIGPDQRNSIKQWNAIDTLSWTLGRHSLKFGSDYLWRNPVLQPYSLYLLPEITSFGNIQSGTLNYLSYDQYYSNPNIKLVNLSFFANDTWRVSKELTLNYGLRWEINPSPSAAGPGLFAIKGNITDPSTITEAPAGTPLFPTVYTNFAPRFGFAYSLRDDARFGTVVRGGAGIFFDTGTAATAAQAAQEGYPYKGNGSLSNVLYSSVDWKGLVSSTPSLPQSTLYITDPYLQAPRTYQWSLTVEQKLGASSTLATSYVGNEGQKLASTIQEYTGYAGYTPIYFQNPLLISSNGTFDTVTNSAESNYQSLQMQLRSRIGQRLDAIASWTWSHNINDGDSDFQGLDTIAQYSGRGDSSNDIRHIFSAAIHYSPVGFQGNRVLRSVTGGWAVDTIALLQTASPLSVTAESTAFLQSEYNQLADVVSGVPTILHTAVNPETGNPVPGGKMLNPAAFATPTCACNGTSQMNGYRLFGLTEWDLAASRNWNLSEKATFNFRVDAFNILNIANFAGVESSYASYRLSTFGEAQNTYAGNSPTGELNPAFQNGGARSIQLSAKIKF